MTTEDQKGEWPLWTLAIIPILLVFAGLLGACDPPEANAAVPADAPVVAAGFSPDVLAYLHTMYQATNPCPPNLTAGQPRSAFDADAITACIRWVWPDDIEERAIAIVFGESPAGELSAPWRGGGRCVESGGNPNAQGKNYKNGKLSSTDTGVFQINSGNRRIFERAGFDWFMTQYDPEVNIRAGLWLYENSKSGWRNWTCANRSWGQHG